MTKKQPLIVVGIPTGTGRPHHSACNSIIQSVIEASQFAKVSIDWRPGALIYKDRWLILQDAYKTGADYVFFLDDDMLMAQGWVERLWKTIKSSAFVAVSGVAPMRNVHTQLCVSWKHPEGMMDPRSFPGHELLEENPVYEVNGFGNACCLIDLKRLKSALSHLSEDGEWDPEDHWQNPFLPVKVRDPDKDKNYVLGEDLAFCRQIKQGGGRLAIDYRVRPGHLITAPIHFSDFLHEYEIMKEYAKRNDARPKLLMP